jgi:transglutaminase-like putative cysteine protease
LKAVTYNMENGKVKETKMDKSSIFDKELYKTRYLKRLALPDIKDGSIIEVTYTVNSDFTSYPKPWNFQHPYPIIWSEYRFAYPQYFYYALNQEGYNRLTVNENNRSSKTVVFSDGSNDTYSVSEYRWVMQDVPSLRSEAYITTASDYFDKIEFQLQSFNFPGSLAQSFNDSWNKFSKDLIDNSDLGNKLRKRGAVEDLLKTIVEGKTTSKDKLIAIMDYVKSNINVKNEGFLTSDRSHKKVLEEKVGSVGDVNLLLGAMLAEVGIKVKPVLLSTRSHGRVAMNYPLLDRFNHVIIQAQVDTNFVLLDASSPLLPIGVLPFDLLNGQGLLLDAEKPEWINLQATKMTDLVVADVTIENKGASEKILRGSLLTTQKSYKGFDNRKRIIVDGEDKHAKAMLEKLITNGSLKSQEFTNVKNPTESLKGKFEFETTDFMDVNDEHIYFSPMLSYGWTNNPFKKAERLYPMDFAHPFDELYNFSIKVPDGYIVEELPKSTKIQWEDGSVVFHYIVVPMNEQGIVKINSKIQFKKPVYEAKFYADLKGTFDQIISKHAEQIVLKKQAK